MITTYRDLSIGKWAEIQAIAADTERDELDRQVAVLALLSDKTEAEVLALPLADYKRMVADASFLTRPDDGCAPRAARQYICGPFTLKPVTDVRKVTAAQFIDFQQYRRKGDTTVVELLSCLLVPKGCKYMDGYDIAEVQAAIGADMSTYDGMGLLAFFLTKLAELLAHFLTYSEQELAKMPEGPTKEDLTRKLAAVKASMTAGDGLQTSTS